MIKFKVGDIVRRKYSEDCSRGRVFYLHETVPWVNVEWETGDAWGHRVHELELVENGLETMLKVSFGD